MKITHLLTTLFFISTLTLSAQKEETIFNSTDIRIFGIWASIDHNYNFFEEEYGYARGFNIGIEVSRSLYIGYARNNFRQEPVTGPESRPLDLNYEGLLLAYTPNAERVIHPRIGFFAGGGKASVENVGEDNVYVLKPSVGIDLNATQWFRLGLEAGYRFVTYDDLPGYDSSDLSSPYVNIALRFGLSWND